MDFEKDIRAFSWRIRAFWEDFDCSSSRALRRRAALEWEGGTAAEARRRKEEREEEAAEKEEGVFLEAVKKIVRGERGSGLGFWTQGRGVLWLETSRRKGEGSSGGDGGAASSCSARPRRSMILFSCGVETIGETSGGKWGFLEFQDAMGGKSEVD